MITVTGKPRCGTSMMTRCIHLAGVPLAFKEFERKEEMKERMRNIYGFYEGMWNGEDGVIKCFGFNMIDKFPNPRLIVMTRDEDKIRASWKEVHSKTPFKKPPKLTPEQIAKIKEQRKNFTPIKRPERFLTLEDVMAKYPHITVEYDTFVNDPEQYRRSFEKLFPELDFNLIKSGVDKRLYVNR